MGSSSSLWDSPHPRGWTVRRRGRRLVRLGFPAPAGMDPPTGAAKPARAWIPRTRGDGPRSGPTSAARCSDSPHPRGWTLVAAARCGRHEGFPAPAGMDPNPPCGSTRPGRIPRTRGDGPLWISMLLSLHWDSPHPRGWTPIASGAAHGLTGFPAPAGMDPRHRPYPSRPGRIPRTRGDGPRSWQSACTPAADSPHPRGWTRRPSRAAVAPRGFPAPAGMDPPRR